MAFSALNMLCIVKNETTRFIRRTGTEKKLDLSMKMTRHDSSNLIFLYLFQSLPLPFLLLCGNFIRLIGKSLSDRNSIIWYLLLSFQCFWSSKSFFSFFLSPGFTKCTKSFSHKLNEIKAQNYSYMCIFYFVSSFAYYVQTTIFILFALPLILWLSHIYIWLGFRLF